MSTHNLCFGVKIRKIGIPCIPQFYLRKVGYKGVFMSWTCFPDEVLNRNHLARFKGRGSGGR